VQLVGDAWTYNLTPHSDLVHFLRRLNGF